MLAALAREGVENTSLAFLPLFFHDPRTLCAAHFSPVSISDVTSKTLLKSGANGCLGVWTHTCFVLLIFAALSRECYGAPVLFNSEALASCQKQQTEVR